MMWSKNISVRFFIPIQYSEFPNSVRRPRRRRSHCFSSHRRHYHRRIRDSPPTNATPDVFSAACQKCILRRSRRLHNRPPFLPPPPSQSTTLTTTSAVIVNPPPLFLRHLHILVGCVRKKKHYSHTFEYNSKIFIHVNKVRIYTQ